MNRRGALFGVVASALLLGACIDDNLPSRPSDEVDAGERDASAYRSGDGAAGGSTGSDGAASADSGAEVDGERTDGGPDATLDATGGGEGSAGDSATGDQGAEGGGTTEAGSPRDAGAEAAATQPDTGTNAAPDAAVDAPIEATTGTSDSAADAENEVGVPVDAAEGDVEASTTDGADGAATDAADASIDSGPAAPDGSCGGGTLQLLGAADISGITTSVSMAVNPKGDLVYAASGFGQTGMIRIDASDPTNPAVTTIGGGGGGGVSVNPATGRIATTTGYGDQLQVYNSDLTLYDQQSLQGCGGGVAGWGGTFGFSTQCSDHFVVYNENTKTIVFTSANAVGSDVVFNGATNTYYDNYGQSGVFNVLVVPAPYQSNTTTVLSGIRALAANGTTNRVYAATTSYDIEVLDGSDNSVITTIAGANAALMAANTVLNRFYVLNYSSGSLVQAYDGSTNAPIASDTFSLPQGYTWDRLAMAEGDTRLYVIARNSSNGLRLFILQEGC